MTSVIERCAPVLSSNTIVVQQRQLISEQHLPTINSFVAGDSSHGPGQSLENAVLAGSPDDNE
jgi:hypothetical protein